MNTTVFYDSVLKSLTSYADYRFFHNFAKSIQRIFFHMCIFYILLMLFLFIIFDVKQIWWINIKKKNTQQNSKTKKFFLNSYSGVSGKGVTNGTCQAVSAWIFKHIKMIKRLLIRFLSIVNMKWHQTHEFDSIILFFKATNDLVLVMIFENISLTYYFFFSS